MTNPEFREMLAGATCSRTRKGSPRCGGGFENVSPIANIRPAGDTHVVRVSVFLDGLSKRAPIIVVLTLCAALVGAWTSAPVWLANGLAIIVGSLALVLLAARGRRNQLKTPEELGFTRLGDRIAYELAGKGSPPGFYLLGFFAFMTIFLTGLQSPYSKPAWAGFFLCVVWGIANARYQAEDASEY
jgi:hypothetical protein